MTASEGLVGLLEELKSLTRSSDALSIPTSVSALSEALSRPAAAEFEPPSLCPSLPAQEEPLLPVEYLQQCGEGSLSGIAVELRAAQYSQANQMEQKKQSLWQLQEQLTKEKKLCGYVERELVSAAREVCQSQETCANLTVDCADLREEIERLLDGRHKAELRLVRAEEHAQQLQTVVQRYREKMSTHMTRTEDMESSLPAYRELEELRERADALRERRSEYMKEAGLELLSGEQQRTLQEQLDNAQTSLVNTEEEIKDKKKLMKEYKERVKQLKKDIELKKKRRGAQLTRLQRQTSEAQSRQRQLIKETERLQHNITHLQQRLRE